MALSADGVDVAFAAFCRAYPAYDGTAKLDEMRATEYARLDRSVVFMDYLAGGRPLRRVATAQTHGDAEHPRARQSGSSNPTSAATTELVESARSYALTFFSGVADEYEVIFTLNASGALKLVGESYPFEAGGHDPLAFDNHNSVNGIREFAGEGRERRCTAL